MFLVPVTAMVGVSTEIPSSPLTTEKSSQQRLSLCKVLWLAPGSEEVDGNLVRILLSAVWGRISRYVARQ